MEPGFLDINGVSVKIERIVAMYDVWTMDRLPFPRFVIKVVHRVCGDYQAVPNVSVRNVNTGCCEYTCGLAPTADEAVIDAIRQFFIEAEKQSQHKELDEHDFVWTSTAFDA